MRLQANTSKIFKFSSIYWTLNFKITKPQKQNYIFIQKPQLVYLQDNAFVTFIDQQI